MESATTWRERFQNELFIQLKTSIPASLSSIVYKVPWLISVAFVGRLGSNELAAAALATSLCNVTGLSLSLGLSSAVTTLTGQSKGEMQRRRRVLKRKRNSKRAKLNASNQEEKKVDPDESTVSFKHEKNYGSTNVDKIDMESGYKEDGTLYPMTPKTYLYRGIFIQLMFVLPVGIYWIIGIKPLLVALGQEETIAEMAANYLRMLTPGLWSYSMNFTFNSWLQAIEMADVPMYGGMVGLIFHIPMNILFIYKFGWGYQGAAAATSTFQILQPLATLYYLFIHEHGKSRIYQNTGADTLANPVPFLFDVKRAICSYRGISQYLGLALPGIVIISEWWASEIAIFLSGRLPSPAITLATMTIYQSINSSCFMLPVGVSVACSTRVSNLLGSQDPIGASLASKVSIVSAAFVGLLMSAVLVFTPHTFFPSLFTPDTDIIGEASKTLPFLAVYVFADGIQYTINGIVKGCGKQCIVMPIVIVAYWVVGLPLAYFFAFQWQYSTTYGLNGVIGLVAGMTIGTWTHFLLLALVVGLETNWEVEVIKAQERLRLEQDQTKILNINEEEQGLLG